MTIVGQLVSHTYTWAP